MNDAATPSDKYPWRGHWLLVVTYCCLGLFFGLPFSYTRMVAWPWLLVWQLGFLATGSLAIWMLRQSHQPFKTLGYGLDWGLGLFGVSIVLSIAMAPVPQLAAWYGAMASGYGVLFYVLRNWISSSPAYLHRLWLGIVAAGLGTNLVSLVMWQPTLSMWQTNDFYEAVRNAMPLGHHNFMGGFEVLMLPLALTFARARAGWGRWLGIVASLLSLLILYASGSRGAMVGALVMVLSAITAAILQTQGKQRLLATGLGGLALLGGVAMTMTNPRTRQLLSFVQNARAGQAHPLTALLVDGPILDRWQFLQTAGQIWQDKPLTGVGLGNMVQVFNLYRPLTLGSQLEHAQQLHNTPAQWLGELGLVGLLAALAGTVCWLWLWFWLSRQPLLAADRWLTLGAGTSLLAYGVFSLTDYQLENIPIAALILFNLVALVSLATHYGLPGPLPPVTIPPQSRRLLSLLVLAWFGLVLRLWIPMDAAAYLQGSAARALGSENAVQADAQFNRAAQLTPWDPVPRVLAAHNLNRIAPAVSPDDQKLLQEQTIVYYQQAVAAAPNDAWFHYNLANLLLPIAPQQAEIHAGSTVQLLPRETNYTYFLLGLAYFLQTKTPQAIDAFALETLADPQVISITAWDVPPLSSVTAAVATTSAQLYDQLFDQLDLSKPGHKLVYEQGLLVRWWPGVALPDYQPEALRPIIQALFLAESDPNAALNLLNQRVDIGQAGTPELLLRAWLQPDTYLQDYLTAAELSPQEVAVVTQGITQNRNLRTWLRSEQAEPPRQGRGSLGFAYRNRYASGAEELFRPEGIRLSQVAARLGLFTEMPRLVPELDRLMNQYRTEQLNLPHPSQTGFQLTNPAAGINSHAG
jgi:putative inorganic carbon (HCO3(-)) transporter